MIVTWTTSFAELEQVCWVVGWRACAQMAHAGVLSWMCEHQSVWAIRLGVQSELVSDGEWAVIAFMSCSVRDLIRMPNLNTWQEWDCVSLQAMKRVRSDGPAVQASWGWKQTFMCHKVQDGESVNGYTYNLVLYRCKLSPRPNMSSLKCVKVTKTFYKCQAVCVLSCVHEIKNISTCYTNNHWRNLKHGKNKKFGFIMKISLFP